MFVFPILSAGMPACRGRHFTIQYAHPEPPATTALALCGGNLVKCSICAHPQPGDAGFSAVCLDITLGAGR